MDSITRICGCSRHSFGNWEFAQQMRGGREFKDFADPKIVGNRGCHNGSGKRNLVLIAQQVLLDFAHRIARQCIHDKTSFWNFEVRETLLERVD